MASSFFIPIIVAYSTLAISPPKARRLFRQASAIVERDTSIRLRPIFIRQRIPRYRNVNAPEMLLSTYTAFFPLDERIHTIMIVPAGVNDRGLEAISGMAPICGTRGIMTYGKKTMWEMNRTVLVHELGHMLGASHSDTADVMNPMPNHVGIARKWEIGFSPESIKQITECTHTEIREPS